MKNICHNPTWLFAIEHPLEKTARTGLILGLAVCTVVYLFLIGGTVMNLMERKEAALSATKIAQNVAQLEAEYLSLSQGIQTIEASDFGLLPIEASSYVYEPGATALAIPRAL